MATRKIAAKKTKAVAGSRAQTDIQYSANDIWLASLGAVSITRKKTADVFGNLLQEGQNLQQRSLQIAEGTVNGVRKQVVGVVGKVQQTAASNLAQFEEVVGGQVSRVLSRLGIPSKSDIQELSRRVAELNKQVRALQSSRKPSDAKAA